MAAPRILLTALLACTAAVAATAGLAACTPADDNPTVAAASAEIDDTDDDDLASPADAPDDTAEAPTASSGASATDACTEAGERPGHRVLQVIADEPGELTALATRYVCASDRYQAVGSPERHTFATAGVDATLVDRPHGEPAKPVPLPDLLGHLDDCLADRAPAAPYGCYGNTYDVVLDSHGRIMRIAELDHP
ncbi:hypothetical protein F7Q99_19500 [Streptomyces kaniharaensis]|uniref:Lipoprotein n=1 Tax=Streptomyces kaniharaensis TaxID=212423 RepID=A0A6N7KVP3_9ACTN|nr:hypothetical protein [Streptomyces kaniharaensis]MQS14387.1 hypothetical protein [Streptomyces kaniharaensis]